MIPHKLRAHLRRILNRNGSTLDACRKGKTWDAVFVNLSVKPAELKALFEAAGISPDNLKTEKIW